MKQSFPDLLASHPLILVYFYATWCGPCKTLGPILSQVKAELQEEIKIIKIDVDKNPSIAAQYQVKGVPTLIAFKKGQNVWRQSGVLQKDVIIGQIKAAGRSV